jgi:hypothetical protein
MMIEMGIARYWENSLSRFVGMLKGPEALPAPKEEMMSTISSGSHGLSARFTGFGAPRYDWKGDLPLGIFSSIEGPIFTK